MAYFCRYIIFFQRYVFLYTQ